MTVDVVSVICGPSRPELPGCTPLLFDNNDNAKTPCQCYQEILEASTADVIVYAHSDLDIHEESWMESITAPFRMSDCVAVGLGGATSLGRPNLYKQPYRIENMARGGYCSNQDDWEVHGSREQGTKRIAVPEAFCMAVRREWILEIGGWPVGHITHHGIDMWLACEAARHGKEIWMVGISCLHHGGGVSVSDKYRSAKWLQGQSMESDHQTPHLWLYNEYRDVLPIIYADERRPVRDPSAVTGGSVSVDAAAMTHETQNQKEVHEEKRQEAEVTGRGGKCNVVMVTNGRRLKLFHQALDSLYRNTHHFTLTLVCDGDDSLSFPETHVSVVTVRPASRVLSRLKNLGVHWSEKQFGRGEWLCIVDDDVAFFPGWMEKMIDRATRGEKFGSAVKLLGGIRHPFHGVNANMYSSDSVQNMMTPDPISVEITDAVAGYCHFMHWETWDQFGPYEGNAEGIGQSEDFAFSRKIVDAGYRVGYIHPPVMAHCGITNSLGKPATGAELFPRVEGVLYE